MSDFLRRNPHKTLNLVGSAFRETSVYEYRMRPTSLGVCLGSASIESHGLTWTNGNLTQDVVTNSLVSTAFRR